MTALEYLDEKREQVLDEVHRKGVWRGEVMQSRKDGKRIFVQTTLSSIKDKEGVPIGLVGVNRDFTKRKQAEEELKIKDSAIASSLSAIGIADLEGTLMYVNDSLVEMWGYESADEILGRKLPEFWEGEGIFKTIEALREKGGKIGEDIGKRKDGSVFDVQFSASIIKDEAGKPLYMFGSFIDISERKEANQNYRTVADFTYDWEYWANLDGTLKYVSPSCERVSGYSVQDFMDNPSLLREIVVPEDLMIWDKHFHDSRKELQATEVIYRIHRRDGEIRWIEHACQPVTDNTGRSTGFRASNRDITTRKQAENDLRQSYVEIEQLKSQLEAESAYLQDEIKLQHNFENIIGQSEALKYVLHRVEQVAPTNSPVLIMGETGTGKELMARALHRLSPHGKRALVKVNCAALPG
ncbi:MAG: PAS domain S-box protein, partial [Deltaproteobacteria bacterium]|nr:PAS domain S-box protein [Deltaproteobacteria bacterium]